jgi:predicted SAM-dependent methyltransferase
MIKETKIDLACGANKKEGFFGIDISKCSSVDAVVDLQKYPWPIESESVEELHCSHYIEHIPHTNIITDVLTSLNQVSNFDDFKKDIQTKWQYGSKDGLILFMDEVYRILKPGAVATIICPYYASIRAFGDPTHVRYIGEWSFYYFNKEWRDTNKLSHYGINSDFDMRFSHYITNELVLKSEEVRQHAFTHYWNAIDDIIVELKKR